MNFAGPLSRIVALSGLTLATLPAAAPAFAAKADVALVQSYIGTWKGSSELAGMFPARRAAGFHARCR